MNSSSFTNTDHHLSKDLPDNSDGQTLLDKNAQGEEKEDEEAKKSKAENIEVDSLTKINDSFTVTPTVFCGAGRGTVWNNLFFQQGKLNFSFSC